MSRCPSPDLARPPEEIRARRHPWALLGLWAWQTGLALVVGWPAAALARAACGHEAGADATLWQAGGHVLVDALWHETHALAALTRTAALALLISALAGLVPLAALMAAMAYAAPERGGNAGLARSGAVGLGAFRAFSILLVVLGLAEVAVVGVGVAAAELLESALHQALGEAGAQRFGALVVAAFLVATSAILVTHDLSRAAAVCSRVGGWRALALGVRSFRTSTAPLWWSWAWRTAAGIALVAAGAQVVGRLRADSGWGMLVCVALVHQGIVVSRVALRASWLARALRAVACDHSAEWSA
jgi:hypothetical protein